MPTENVNIKVPPNFEFARQSDFFGRMREVKKMLIRLGMGRDLINGRIILNWGEDFDSFQNFLREAGFKEAEQIKNGVFEFSSIKHSK